MDDLATFADAGPNAFRLLQAFGQVHLTVWGGGMCVLEAVQAPETAGIPRRIDAIRKSAALEAGRAGA